MEIPLRQYLVLVTFSLCLYLNVGFVCSLCLEDQHSSLLKLKQTLIFNPALSSKLVSWDSSIHCCSWPGVTCSGSGHVIGLDLSEESISGGIDNSSSLFNLHHLESLSLAWNSFNGTRIPSGLGRLVNLRHLNLSNSEFSGQIPAEISSLTRLVSLDFSIQSLYVLKLEDPYVFKLEDPNLLMLVRNLRSLTELHLQGADLSAEAHNWGRALSSLPRLRVLDLGSCDLRGKFPTKVFQPPTLQSLDISDNPLLQGSLPEFPENGPLQTLVLSATNFSGIIPDSIGNLKGLSRMDLSFCNVKGSIPNSIGSLANLVVLDLSWNLLSGSIPSSFSMLKNLTDLNLSNNNFSGVISSIHWENLSSLVYLELRNNSLEGIIPSALFSLPSLQMLYLSNNRFSGQIGDYPVVTSSQLVELDLSCNRLEGPIPSSFFKLQGLQLLILSYNKFSGTLELSIIQKLGNLSTLDLSFNHLSVDEGIFGNVDLASFPQLLELRLASCKLRKFPSFLRNQSDWWTLDLSDNQIPDEIPNWICNHRLYHLNLSHNLLTKIGGSFRNNSPIEYLDLHSNQLQGDISNLAQAAYLIDYSENQFNSVIPVSIGRFLHQTSMFLASGNYLCGVIPESICSMDSLKVLDLSRNSLSGTVPWCLINMTQSGSFSVLNLRRNNLMGTIPDAFSSNCGLQTLNLNENSLQGKLPKSLANCKMLGVLDIGNNGINDSFPCWLNTISTLQVLVLRSNKFSGSIECPMSNGTLPLLQIVDLAANKFGGKLPKKFFETWAGMLVSKDGTQATYDYHYFDRLLGQLYYYDLVKVTDKGLEIELVKILTRFMSIDFSCNNFEGKIPEVIGEFKALIVLNLSHNSLTGPIPSSLGNLNNLESLDLSSNNLKGNIPQQLGGLNFLAVLNLSHNQLEGRIPIGNQLQTFSEDSFKDNKGLCGTPLMDCRVNMQPPSEGKNSDNGTKIDWNLINVEGGFVFGLAIVILPLMFWKRWRIWYYKRVDSVLFRIFPQLNQRSKNNGQRALKTHRRRN